MMPLPPYPPAVHPCYVFGEVKGNAIGDNLGAPTKEEQTVCLNQAKALPPLTEARLERALQVEESEHAGFRARWFRRNINGQPFVCPVETVSEAHVEDTAHACLPAPIWFQTVYRPHHRCDARPAAQSCAF